MQLVVSAGTLATDWTSPPGVISLSAGSGAAGEKGMPSANKAYPL